MAWYDDIVRRFKHGNSFTKILFINIGVFVIIKLLLLSLFLFKVDARMDYNPVAWLSLPANLELLGERPWSLITYMFLHEDVLHILFNMIIFWWFGKIFVDHIGAKRLTWVYLLGGISGGLFYIGAFNFFPVFEDVLPKAYALGASASVMAVAVAIAFYAPNLELMLMFIGRVKLKHLVMFYVIIDFLSIASENSGGHIAHIGGAFLGMVYILQMKNARGIFKGIGASFSGIGKSFKRKPKMKATFNQAPRDDYDYNYNKAREQAEIDRILDKIKQSGYESLSKQEKDTLFNSSNRR